MAPIYALMIHGGAGAIPGADDPARAAGYARGMQSVLARGREILAAGGSALDAVETCARMLEDDPHFNAGRGSVLNADGRVEMDAGIMDGRALRAGAVAVVSGVRNPVSLARLVMEESGHLLLAGDGALRFARDHGVPLVPEDWFVTPETLAGLEAARQSRATTPGADADGDRQGTIGAVALDLAGHLAAATSTGGIVGKRPGRIGDSPLVGAGVYADDTTCAVSATGHGEDLMRAVIAKRVADGMELGGRGLQAAVDEAVAWLARRLAGRGGVIAVDRDGTCARGHTTRRMIWGRIERGGEAEWGF